LGLAIAFLVPFFKVMFVTTGVGFAHSPWFGVAVVGGILACGSGGLVVNGAVSKKIYHLRDKYFTLNRLFSFYGDMLTDYNSGKEIRIFDSQDLILRHATTELRDKGVIIQKQIGLSRAWSSTFLVLMLAFLSYGIYAIIGLKGAAGLFGLGALVRYVGGFLQLVRCIFSVAKALGNLVHTKKHLKVFFGLIGMKEKVSGNEICTEPQSISVKNLGFCYPDAENKALDDVTIDLPIGEKIAIVGENGSGKSTFVKLLCGLYAPTDGEILLNGCPLSSYTNDSLCTQFSTVFQDFQLFSLPLGENVACKETVNKSTVHEKLEQVGFKKHHDLDVYLYHDLTTNGIEISGGEAQKLALARALYHDAPIVILDEPTAALDPFAEQEIYRKFDALIGGKTVLYISHRLSSCYFCDKIAVFDKGKLVQFGIHQALLADTQGKYFELWDTQAKYYI
jgi:ATP-binding cassette subfamily B protein